MENVLITGGSGFIGSAITDMLLSKGYSVTILSRSNKHSGKENVQYAQWDIQKQTIDKDAIKAADFLIHLAGAGVADKRWTEERKQEIRESRTQSSALIVKALSEIPNKVKAVISASAIGWYGEDKPNGEPFTEEMPADDSFLGETCRLWENSIQPVEAFGKRLVILRTGIVLGKGGGALQEFKKPVNFGIAGILGSGLQMVSWIHLQDLCKMYLFAIEQENLKGVFNAVGPNPATNKELTIAIAQKLKGSFFIPFGVPEFVLKLMLGEMSIEILKSATVSAKKIKSAGFKFSFATLPSALEDLLNN